MDVLHATGIIGEPVPVYYESFAPETPRATVLMIHGGAHSGACYQRTGDDRPGWAYRFAERGYRAVVPDWPGSGRSGHVPLDRLDGVTVVEGLGALARSLAPPAVGTPLVLLTHSMSGAYGWRAGKRVLIVTGTADLDHAKEIDGAIATWLNGHGAKAEFCFLADRGIVG